MPRSGGRLGQTRFALAVVPAEFSHVKDVEERKAEQVRVKKQKPEPAMD
jgi:hypothetical protein